MSMRSGHLAEPNKNGALEFLARYMKYIVLGRWERKFRMRWHHRWAAFTWPQ
jgi:hypothetical protein